MKKTLTVLLLCAILIAIVPFAAFAETEDEPIASFYGYQRRFNYDEMAVDYRIVGTLTLSEHHSLAEIDDVGFSMVLSDGKVTVTPTVSCEKVYSSIQGEGVTYCAGTGEDTESVRYIGGDYLFVLVIQGAPADLVSSFVPYITYGGDQHNNAGTDITLTDNENAPKTLADGTKVKLVPVSEGGVFPENTSAVGILATDLAGGKQSVFDGNRTVDLSEYRGMMIKVTTGVASKGGMQFRFQFKMASNGQLIDSKSNPRTYYHYKNGTWTAVAATAQQFTMQMGETYAYFEFPFGTSELTGTFTELTASEVSNLKIYKPKSDTRIGAISEWYLVKAIEE